MSALVGLRVYGERMRDYVSVSGHRYVSKTGSGDIRSLVASVGGVEPSPTDLELRALMWASVWAQFAFPTLEPSHRLAASLMCTSSTGGDVCFPWNQFAIRIPDGLATFVAGNGSRCPVHMMLVSWWPGDMCSYDAWSDNGHCIITAARPLSALSEEMSDPDIADDGCVPLDSDDRRLVRMLDRLLVGCCRELSSKENQLAINTGPAQGRRLRDAPRAWTFKLARPVKVDCRDTVSRYLLGTSRSVPSVQCLVRGHWRRQHRAEQTEWIQIEPYWRGPEDAPIAVRSHQIA